MKRIFCGLALLIVLLTLPLGALASDKSISVSGGLATGQYDYGEGDYDLKGFWGSGSIAIYGPFGVKAAASKATIDDASDWTITEFGLFGTYELPIDNFTVLGLAGYQSRKEDYGPYETFKGFVIGAEGSVVPLAKVELRGLVHIGIGTKFQYDDIEQDASLSCVSVTACYQILPSVSAELGYRLEKYSCSDLNYDTKISEFTVGARVNF